jgi:hypothetical protein
MSIIVQTLLIAAKDTTVSSVNLYAGQADITRVVRVNLKAGQNKITFHGLPVQLLQDKLRFNEIQCLQRIMSNLGK